MVEGGGDGPVDRVRLCGHEQKGIGTGVPNRLEKPFSGQSTEIAVTGIAPRIWSC
jgi:hypothetical protein